MSGVNATGFSFEWARLKRVPCWFFETWPILIPLVFAVVHLGVVQSDGLGPDAVRHINRWIAAGLQVLGVGFILYSIDANLREFQLDSLKARCRGYFRRFPLLVLTHDLIIASGEMKTRSDAAAIRLIFPGDTIEGRLMQLEADVKWIEAKIATQGRDLREHVQEVTAPLARQLDNLTNSTRALEGAIKSQTRDGVPLQLFGAALVIYSAVTGVFT